MSHVPWGVLRVALALPWANCRHAVSETSRYHKPFADYFLAHIHPLSKHRLAGMHHNVVSRGWRDECVLWGRTNTWYSPDFGYGSGARERAETWGPFAYATRELECLSPRPQGQGGN